MVQKFDDSNRQIQFKSPLAGDLVAYRMTGKEELGRLYEFNLGLLSPKNDIDFTKIIGQRVTLQLQLSSGERYFDGYVTEFSYTGETDRFTMYEATVRPWLWRRPCVRNPAFHVQSNQPHHWPRQSARQGRFPRVIPAFAGH